MVILICRENPIEKSKIKSCLGDVGSITGMNLPQNWKNEAKPDDNFESVKIELSDSVNEDREPPHQIDKKNEFQKLDIVEPDSVQGKLRKKVIEFNQHKEKARSKVSK